jgi:hypothetical protein
MAGAIGLMCLNSLIAPNKVMKRETIREKILQHISNNIGWRIGNIQRGTASVLDKQLVDEALAFRSLCIFANLDDKQLKRLWDESNLEFML